MLGAPAVHAQGASAGVALVIGNSKYRWEASLPNVKRDAPDIAKRFQALGLKTELLQDVGRDAMRRAIDAFTAASRGVNLAAFYFAGHGASWDKDTYLVPEDADLANPGTVQSLLPVSAVSAAVKDANHRLLVLDNCRNNPADGWRQRAASEQSRVAATELAAAAVRGPNTLVVFSTAPGRTALDGPAGENSPFAAALLRQLDGTAVDLSSLAAKLRRDLLIATEGQQIIWDENTYTAPFVLNGPANRQSGGPRNHVDPGQLVELPKAYAFAREKKLLLPQGLVAIRRRGESQHSQKIGAYEYTSKTAVGQKGTPGNGISIEPCVMIVVSIRDSDSAQIIVAARDFRVADGPYWRFTTGRFAQDEMTWSYPAGGTIGDVTDFFAWKDQNSGRFTSRPAGWGNTSLNSSHFTRLDG